MAAPNDDCDVGLDSHGIDLAITIHTAWGPRDSSIGPLAIADYWVRGAANLSLMAMLLIPICQTAKGQSKPAIFSILLTVLIAVLWICTLSIGSKQTLSKSYKYQSTNLILVVTRDSSMVFASAVVCFIISREQARRMHLQNSVARNRLSFLIILQLGNTLLKLIRILTDFDLQMDYSSLDFEALFAAWDLSITIPASSSLAAIFFSYFFFTGAMLSALYTITSPNFDLDLIQPASYDPLALSPSDPD
ncbi:hypothetical protein BJY04DRAFT_224509 [Aspergillus karnatakaensis]|uniref:uncharacterized protein n=1 Tax=Aspergillus karnatakaensis TaxID=1810916 RepID=UPI003CCD4337